jgi:hypothetical protein
MGQRAIGSTQIRRKRKCNEKMDGTYVEIHKSTSLANAQEALKHLSTRQEELYRYRR